MSPKSFEKLLSNLIKETRFQEKLLSLLAEERNCIVTLKTDKLAEVQKRKEKLLVDVLEHADERSSILGDLGYVKSPRGRNTFKISECIETCEDQNLRHKLEISCEELKSCTESVKKLNAENGDILKTSLGLVSNTISIINARPAIEDTNYKKDGKVHSERSSGVHSNKAPISSFSKSA